MASSPRNGDYDYDGCCSTSSSSSSSSSRGSIVASASGGGIASNSISPSINDSGSGGSATSLPIYSVHDSDDSSSSSPQYSLSSRPDDGSSSAGIYSLGKPPSSSSKPLSEEQAAGGISSHGCLSSSVQVVKIDKSLDGQILEMSEKGIVKEVEMLIDIGADPNAKNKVSA